MIQQFGDAYRYWKVKTKDFIIWTGTFCATIILDIPLGSNHVSKWCCTHTVQGMAVSIALSVVILLYGSSKPYTTTLVPVI